MKTFMIVVSLLALSASVYGRVFETVKECSKRYGLLAFGAGKEHEMDEKQEKKKPAPLVEDETVVGGTDAETGAPVIRPKTSEGRADESTKPTDPRER